MLAGHPPFAGGNIQPKMARHAAEAIRPLEMLGVPQPLAQIVAYLMAKNPAVRFQSAAMVAEQLAAFVDPAILYAQPPLPPATLANFEYYLRQKQSRLAGQAAQPAAVPVVVRAVSPAPVAEKSPRDFRTGRDHLSELAATAATASGPAAGPDLGVAPARRGGQNPDEILRRREAEQKRNLVVGLVVAGVVAVTAIIGFNMLPRDNRPIAANGTANAAGPSALAPGDNTPAPPVTPASTNPSAAAPTTNTPDSPPPTAPVATPVVETGIAQEVVPDDGQALWASPTAGPPVSFRGVPPEAQLFLDRAAGRHARRGEGRAGAAGARPDLRRPAGRVGEGGRLQARRDRAADRYACTTTTPSSRGPASS